MSITRTGLIFFVMVSQLTPVNAAACDPAAFREVVTKASAAINDMQSKNSQVLQARLQQLRAVKGWTEADFTANAAPYVKDDVTASLDAANQGLLAKVQSMQGGADTDPARCPAMVAELNSLMSKIVENTSARWQHMIAKVTAGSSGPLHAGAAR